MSQAVRDNLEAGFALALERLRESDSCAGLFRRLGADPVEILATGLYFPVDSHYHEIALCGRNAFRHSATGKNLAYTTAGGAPTFICKGLAGVPPETVAVVVIHEALHHAGLDEYPHDRLAMTSREITEMVEEACGF